MKNRNVYHFTLSKDKLTENLYNFLCREQEILFGLRTFDKTRYPVEYMILEDELLVLLNKISHTTEKLKKTDILLSQIESISSFAKCKDVTQHWWYDFLDKEKVGEEIINESNLTIDNHTNWI